MEAAGLIDPAFWRSSTAVAPGARLPDGVVDPPGRVWFRSSGSTGAPRWIGLTRRALLASAAAVNRHLAVGPEDCWGLALPLHHVGGFGVVARAFESGAALARFDARWDPRVFRDWADARRVSHLSLVPTQVHDLVREGLRAPSGLRAVVVGGGMLGVADGSRARALGWPLLASYGMTETASQVATQGLEVLEKPYVPAPIRVLPIWKLRSGDGGRLEVSGPALFSAELEETAGGWRTREREGEWFASSDRVALSAEGLTPLGRLDAQVKVLGELVDPGAIERELDVAGGCVVALPDERRGHRLVAVGDPAAIAALRRAVEHFNAGAEGFRRVAETRLLDPLPRSPLGKPLRSEIVRKLEAEDGAN